MHAKIKPGGIFPVFPESISFYFSTASVPTDGWIIYSYFSLRHCNAFFFRSLPLQITFVLPVILLEYQLLVESENVATPPKNHTVHDTSTLSGLSLSHSPAVTSSVCTFLCSRLNLGYGSVLGGNRINKFAGIDWSSSKQWKKYHANLN